MIYGNNCDCIRANVVLSEAVLHRIPDDFQYVCLNAAASIICERVNGATIHAYFNLANAGYLFRALCLAVVK